MYDCHVWMLWARYGNVWTSHVSQNYVMYTVFDFFRRCATKIVHTCWFDCFRSSTSKLIPSNFICIYRSVFYHVFTHLPRVPSLCLSSSYYSYYSDPALRTCIVFFLYCRRHKPYRKSVYKCDDSAISNLC